MKDFNKMIEEQILKPKKEKSVKEKTVALDLIDEQKASDEEKKFNEKMEELYYKFFIDETLVKIIENQIENITCGEDRHKTFEVTIHYNLYRVNSQMHDLWLKRNRLFSSIRGIAVSEPHIGETLNISGKNISDRDMGLVCKVLPKWILLHNQLSFDTWNLGEKLDIDGERYTTLSFTSSLQKLIDMYYAEKQREAEKISSNNHSKKK